MAQTFYEANIGVEIVISILDSFAALSNLAVLILILRRETLRTVSNLLVAALALTELLVTLFVIPFAIVAYGKRSWPYSEGLCVFHGYFYSTMFITSATLTSVISVERFYSLASPMCHAANISGKYILWTVLFVILQSGFWASFPLFGIGELKYSYMPAQSRCGIKWDLSGAYGTYYFVILMVSFAVPFAAMLLMYIKSFQAARESARKIRPGNVRIQVLQDGQFTSVAQRDSFRSLKANVTVFIIIGSFFISRGPMVICDIGSWYKGDAFCSPVAELSVSWLLFLGPLANPYVYTFLNRRLRKEILQTIQRCLRRKKTSAEEEEPNDIMEYLRNLTDNYVTDITPSTNGSESASRVPDRRPCSQGETENTEASSHENKQNKLPESNNETTDPRNSVI